MSLRNLLTDGWEPDAAAVSFTASLLFPSGDVTGVTDRIAMEEKIAAAIIEGGKAVVYLWAGPLDPFYIDQQIVWPQYVTVWGTGSGLATQEDGSITGGGTCIRCTAAAAGFALTKGSGSNARGGESGNFTIDGQNISNVGLYMTSVQRTYVAIDVINCIQQHGLLDGAQNNTFIRCNVGFGAGDGWKCDNGAAGNNWYSGEIDTVGGICFHCRNTNQVGRTQWNEMHNVIMERGVNLKKIYQEDALVGDNRCDSCQVAHSETDQFQALLVDAGTFRWTSGLVQNNSGAAAYGDAFTTAVGAILYIDGSPSIVNMKRVYVNSGVTYVNSSVRLNQYTTLLTGNAVIEQQVYGYDGLRTIPCATAIAQALTNASVTVTNSYFTIDPANMPTPPVGHTVQWRIVAIAHTLTAGDILKIQALNSGADGNINGTGVADANTYAVAASPWSAFTARAYGFCSAVNTTAARGTLSGVWLEFRII